VADFPFRVDDRLNLATAEVVLVDGHPEGLELLTQMFAGFGVMKPQRCATAQEAMDLSQKRDVNLYVVDSALGDRPGYDFVQWLRRSGLNPNASAPVILVTGHARAADVMRGRDCGANFVVRKPAPPLVMLQRIMWVARDGRQFVQSPNYCGPDRRFRMLGPPAGQPGRRKDDLPVEVGEATTPNLDQSDIDALFQPRKVIG
jgi:DNA-binding response OmpR family regulator